MTDEVDKPFAEGPAIDMAALQAFSDLALPTEFRRRQEERSPVVMPVYLTELFETSAPTTDGYTPQHTQEDPDLIYGQSVSAFLQAFDVPNKPKILDSLKLIWDERGFLPPDQLAGALSAIYFPDISEQARTLLVEQISERLEDQEPLTGYQRKQHAPLVTGLSHLFAVVTEKPVTLVMADYSNMGGTNEFFRELIARAEGKDPTQIADDQAFRYTDEVARIIARLTEQALKEGAHELYGIQNPLVFAHRTGGDELALVCHDLTEAQTNKIVQDYINPAIENFLAEAGLHQHPHSKHQNDRWRDGFGISFAAMALDKETRPGKDIEYADHRINEAKAFTGMKRKGSVPPCGLDTPEMKDLMRLLQEVEALGGESPEATQEASTPEISPETPALQELIEMDPSLEAQGITQAELKEAAYDPTKPVGSKARLEAVKQRTDLHEKLSGHLQSMGHDYESLKHLPPDQLLAEVRRLQADQIAPSLQASAAHYKSLSQSAGTDYKHSHLSRMQPAQAKQLLSNIESVMGGSKYGALRQLPPQQARDLNGDTRSLFRTQLEREHDALSKKLKNAGLSLSQGARSTLEKILGCFSPIDPATKMLMGDLMPEIFGRFAEDAATLRQYVHKQESLGHTDILRTMGISSASDIKARSVCASMHNLGGANALLGHKNADIILHHFANHIIQDSFKATGINPNSIEIGHEGGGRLVIAVRPFAEKETGGSLLITDRHIQEAQKEIQRRMNEFQNTPIDQFIKSKGGVLPDGLPAGLLFKQIEDPKRAYYPGTDVTTTTMELTSGGKGGKLRDSLVTETEARIRQKRDAMQMLDTLKTDFQGRVRLPNGQLVHFSQPQTETPYGQSTRPADQELRRNPLFGNGQNGPSGGA